MLKCSIDIKYKYFDYTTGNLITVHLRRKKLELKQSEHDVLEVEEEVQGEFENDQGISAEILNTKDARDRTVFSIELLEEFDSKEEGRDIARKGLYSFLEKLGIKVEKDEQDDDA
jgi:hypothetical protein